MANFQLLHRIREMILQGELDPKQRITETLLAEKIGLSRTPIRAALTVLAAEGFIEPTGKRGYVIKRFDAEESLQAIELRATLEGLAARYLSSKGLTEAILSTLEECLSIGDELFVKRSLVFADEQRYGDMNALFHKTIVTNCGSKVLIDSIERLNKMPFIGPSVVVFDQIGVDRAYNMLFHAHAQHHAIVDALKDGDGARVEALFREHGNAQKRSLVPRQKQHALKGLV